MSAPAPATPASRGMDPAPAAKDACPLCGAPLEREQEWCLSCGAAARTRLAAAPRWKLPAIGLAALIALSLGVLAAALVALAGGSGSTTASTVTVLSAPAAGAPPQTSTVPTSPPAGATATTPSAGATAPGPSTATVPATSSTPASPLTRTRTSTGSGAVPNPNLGGGVPTPPGSASR